MGQVTLLGVGTVGSAVARACLAAGSRWTLRRALVRDPAKTRGLELPAGVLTANADEALGGDGPVIEVLGNLEPAAT